FRNEGIEECRRFAQEALAIGRETGDQHLLARSLSYLGLASQAEGNPAEGDRLFEESLGIARANGYGDTVATNLTWLGAHANWRGEFARAIETSRQAVVAAREVSDGLSDMISGAFICLSQIGLGQYVEALATIDDGLAKGRDRNNSFIVGLLTNSLGWFYQDLGDPRRALALMEETYERVVKSAFGAHRWRWSLHLNAYLSEALIVTGDSARALEHADRVLRQARETGSMKYEARALGLQGQVLLDAGQPAAARRELSAALALARRIAYPNLTWQTAHLLARAEGAAGRM